MKLFKANEELHKELEELKEINGIEPQIFMSMN